MPSRIRVGPLIAWPVGDAPILAAVRFRIELPDPCRSPIQGTIFGLRGRINTLSTMMGVASKARPRSPVWYVHARCNCDTLVELI